MACIAITGRKLRAHELGRITGFSKSHIAKVLSMLVRAGLLESERGPQGGFYLARAASSISLLEVYEAVEGRLDVDPCQVPCPFCEAVGCLTGGFAPRFNREFKSYMSARKLSDFQDNKTKIEPQNYTK
jgi:Rrf2 family protein